MKRSGFRRLEPYETAAEPLVAANARHPPSVRPHPIGVACSKRAFLHRREECALKRVSPLRVP